MISVVLLDHESSEQGFSKKKFGNPWLGKEKNKITDEVGGVGEKV